MIQSALFANSNCIYTSYEKQVNIIKRHMYVPTNRTLEMSLGSEFNVHPILQLVPHDTENTALIMSWLDTVTVSDKRKKKYD